MEASRNPVGFGRTEATPVLEVDSGSPTDYQRGGLPPEEFCFENEAHERDREGEVKQQPRKEEKKMDDEAFRDYMAQLRRNVREAEKREMKRSAYSDTPGRTEEGLGGGEGGETQEGGGDETRGRRVERPFFPTWEGQPVSPSEPTPQRHKILTQGPRTSSTASGAASSSSASGAISAPTRLRRQRRSRKRRKRRRCLAATTLLLAQSGSGEGKEEPKKEEEVKEKEGRSPSRRPSRGRDPLRSP